VKEFAPVAFFRAILVGAKEWRVGNRFRNLRNLRRYRCGQAPLRCSSSSNSHRSGDNCSHCRNDIRAAKRIAVGRAAIEGIAFGIH